MTTRRLITHVTLALGLAAAGSAFAADKELHVRGEITAVSDTSIVIKARNGATTTVQLPEKFNVLDVSKTDLAAVAENSYIGVAAAPAAAGKVRALGVMVFPEGARGLNEGHFPWDLKQRSTMTNATVAKLLKKGNGAEVEVRWGDKTQTVVIDRSTVFGQFIPGQRSLLATGAKVLVFAAAPEGAAPVARAVMVGRDGFLPPI
ncbi:MAG TPA: hypothetical protein VJ608_03180 [Albitalea sp.]|nr:hypothetical protein [Albitalea sp.]